MAAIGLDLGNLLVHLNADSSHYDKVMKGVERRMKATVKKMTQLATKFAKIGAVAAAAYTAASIKAFATFEEQMANVSTMLDEHTMYLMPAYTKAIKRMAVEFGEGTATLTKGLYDILSASVSAENAIKVLNVSVRAAKAGMTTTAVAADAITSILNSYQMQASQASKVSDILFATVKRGKITFEELAGSVGMVASVASTAGLSLEQVGASIATMTRAGMPAERAITALRAIVTTMLKPQEDAIIAAEEFGLKLSSTTLKAIGLTGVLEKLRKATPEQVAAIFGNVRALTGLSAALKQATEMGEDLELMLNSAGLTQKAYDKMTNTLIHTFRRFWQSIKMVSVSVGERWRDTIERMTEWMISNQRVVENWAIAIADRFVFVAEVMLDLLKFMKTDWVAGFKGVFDIIIQLIIATAKTAIDLSIRMGKGIWKGIKEGLLGSGEAIEREMNRIYEEQQRFMYPGRVGIKTWEEAPLLHQVDLRKIAEINVMAEKTDSVFKGMAASIGKYFTQALDNIKSTNLEVGNILETRLAELYAKDEKRREAYLQTAKNQISGVTEVMKKLTEAAGVEPAAAKARISQIGFTGFKEAWTGLARALQPEEQVQKDMLGELKIISKESQAQTGYLKDVGTVGK